VIAQYRLKIDLEKVKGIIHWLALRQTFELRSFHGLASFYEKFNWNVSGIYVALTTRMGK
jgi:hypothetical protein